MAALAQRRIGCPAERPPCRDCPKGVRSRQTLQPPNRRTRWSGCACRALETQQAH
jgi:hypothetical protein